MSTKINVRSPFYLNLTEPTVPEPEFTCDVANIQSLTIDQQGQISTPDLAYGTLDTITSSDSDFSNNKFATESSATNRDLVLRILIPAGYSNVGDGYIDCPKTITQPAYIPTQPNPSDPPVSCSGGPTANSSISAKTLDEGGDFETVNLASFFNAGSVAIAGYNIYNPKPSLVNATVSGNTLTVSSNNVGGSTNVQVSAFDDASNSCTATQTVTVTVNVAGSPAFSCTYAAFSGGSISQAGAIVKPNSVATVGNIKSSSGGSAITSYSANNTGSNRTVTLYFDLTAPAGFSNVGSTVECSANFIQSSSSTSTFDCATAALFGQQVSSKGQISIGSATKGTIASFTPLSFAAVDTPTTRTVTFTITIPAGFTNSGTINCTASVTQPATTPACGSNSFKISGPKSSPSDFCGGLFSVTKSITSTKSGVTTNLGGIVCSSNAPYQGGNFYYAVSTNTTTVGPGTGAFYIWQIDDNGVVQNVAIRTCPTDGAGNGKGKGGDL